MIVEGIDQRYAQLGKVSYVPRKDHKRVRRSNCRGGRDIRESRVSAGRDCRVGYLTGPPCRNGLQWQDTRAIDQHQLVKPPRERIGPGATTLPAQFADARWRSE